MAGVLIRIALLALGLAVVGAAQVRVKLGGGGRTRSPLEQRIVELTMADKRVAAMQALWAAGEPAVPLLAAEVERGGAAATSALIVLERLGGEAAAAVPVLQRVAARSEPGWRARLLEVLAWIDGPPVILVPRFNANEIVEVDFDGKVLRRVACDHPWGVWPRPDDRLGAIGFGAGNVRHLTWKGEEIEAEKIVESLTCCRRLEDGDRLTTSWNGKGRLARRAPDGDVRWEHEISPIRLDVQFGDEAFVVTRDQPHLKSFSPSGEQRVSVPLPTLCHGLRLLPGGTVLLAAPSDKVLELDLIGKVRSEIEVQGRPNDAFRLRDGRLVVATEEGLVLLAKDGKRIWHCDLGYCGPIWVRAPAGAMR